MHENSALQYAHGSPLVLMVIHITATTNILIKCSYISVYSIRIAEHTLQDEFRSLPYSTVHRYGHRRWPAATSGRVIYSRHRATARPRCSSPSPSC